MYILIILALISNVNSDGDSICDVCVCGYDSRNTGDFQGEIVDCAYSHGVMNNNHTIPNTIYSLCLSASGLSRIDANTILNSKTMQVLYLNSNSITEITTNALQLPQLKQLDLSENMLEYVDKEIFKSINKLEYLNLANNRFTTFSQLMFHPLSELQEIILDNNNIGRSLHQTNLFDRSGYGLTQKIKNVSISGIALNTVPDNFFIDAYDIRKLIITNNNISDIFELPSTLQYLDLSDNPIGEIEGEDFSDVPALRVLKLNNITIDEIPEDAFRSLPSLTHLELERNRNLTEFSPYAFGRSVVDDPSDLLLESLSLKNSKLRKLDRDLRVPFEMLVHLDLQGNPWNCDCNIVWIRELNIPDKETVHFRCQSPRPLFNARVMQLDEKYFVCPIDRHYTGAALAGIALCVILATIAIWFIVVVPRCYKRGNMLRSMYGPSTAYSMLPMSTVIRGVDDL